MPWYTNIPILITNPGLALNNMMMTGDIPAPTETYVYGLMSAVVVGGAIYKLSKFFGAKQHVGIKKEVNRRFKFMDNQNNRDEERGRHSHEEEKKEEIKPAFDNSILKRAISVFKKDDPAHYNKLDSDEDQIKQRSNEADESQRIWTAEGVKIVKKEEQIKPRSQQRSNYDDIDLGEDVSQMKLDNNL